MQHVDLVSVVCASRPFVGEPLIAIVPAAADRFDEMGASIQRSVSAAIVRRAKPACPVVAAPSKSGTWPLDLVAADHSRAVEISPGKQVRPGEVRLNSP